MRDGADLPGAAAAPGHALAIGVTSYDGSVYYGITTDRDLVPDIDVFGGCLHEALDELVDTVGDARPKVPRGRGRRSVRKPDGVS